MSVEEATAPLEGGPPELRALRAEANQLLDGGVAAFGERLDELRGHAGRRQQVGVVVRAVPVRVPLLPVAGRPARATRSRSSASTPTTPRRRPRPSSRELPLPYPSYLDPDQEIADEFLDNAREFPARPSTTPTGELAYVHLGGYPDEDTLAADIDKYAQ